MESVARATRVGWLVVAVIACGFAYSLGFQFGYTNATENADHRIANVNDSLREVIRATEDTAAADATAHARSSAEAAATF